MSNEIHDSKGHNTNKSVNLKHYLDDDFHLQQQTT
jgi:hypothetical protein